MVGASVSSALLFGIKIHLIWMVALTDFQPCRGRESSSAKKLLSPGKYLI